MLRGTQKKMIVVRTRDSRLFEEAYFVMRNTLTSSADSGRDMLTEAHRIISGSLPTEEENPPQKEKKKNFCRQPIWFMLGILSGGGMTALLWLLL